MGEPNEVAHIYPFSIQYEDNRTSFWNTLRVFWSAERVDAWYNAIFPLGTEVCQNLICLAPHAHAYWERAYFVLKPIRISEDKKRLDLQFFWLVTNPHVIGVNILQAPSVSASDQGPNQTMLFNTESRKIRSGDEISLETDDPVLRPLPDFKLLEMQWFLHRVTAMSGAAELQEDFDDNSDDDIATAPQGRWDRYTEDGWDMGVEAEPERFGDGYFPAQSFGAVVALRGGGEHREMEDHEGESYEGGNHEGERREGEESGGY
jgi:hypothetical protein